ncbi:MAG: MFS transporter [Sulfolobales archaeon]
MKNLSIRYLSAIYFIVFISLIDHSTIAPIIAQYARSLGASTSLAGLITASYSIAALLALPLVGVFLDKFSRVRVLQILLIIDPIITLMYTRASDPYQLLVIRSIHGAIDSGVFPSILAIFRDLVTRRLGLGLTIYWILSAIPIIIGNLITRQLVLLYGFYSVFYLVATLFIVGLLLSLYIGREYRELISREELLGYTKGEIISLGNVLIAYASAFTLYLMIGSVVGSMGTLLTEKLRITRELASAEIATWSMISSIISLLFIAVFTSYLVKNPRNLLMTELIGLLMILFSSALLILSTDHLTRVVSSVFYGGALGTILPASSKAATDVRFRRRGLSSAILSLSFLLGVITGSISSSRILEYSLRENLNLNFMPPFIASMILAVYILILLFFSKR